MKMLSKKEGFTLIELMIVVVIIGILASIAIPQFLRYQLKSKTSEAPRNLGSIRTNEEAFSAKFGVYGLAANRPGAAPGTQKQAWGVNTASGFDAIGFAPTGMTFYVYGVGTAVPASDGSFTYASDTGFDASGLPSNSAAVSTSFVIAISAQGDVDGDAALGSFYQTNDNSNIRSQPSTAGETIF